MQSDNRMLRRFEELLKKTLIAPIWTGWSGEALAFGMACHFGLFWRGVGFVVA
jgi:hypothetical protein